MAVSIRFSRLGKKGKPAYRIVAIHKTNKRNGKVLEILGSYDPTYHPSKFQFDAGRLQHWIKNGALPSESVQKLLHL